MYCLVAVVLLSVVSIGVALAGKPAPPNSAITIDNTARKHVNNLTITTTVDLDRIMLSVPANITITDVAAPEGWTVNSLDDINYDHSVIWTANMGCGMYPVNELNPVSLSGFMVKVSKRVRNASIWGYIFDDYGNYALVANTFLTLR